MGMLFFCELYVIRDELALLGRTAHHPRSWASTSYNYTIGPGPVPAITTTTRGLCSVGLGGLVGGSGRNGCGQGREGQELVGNNSGNNSGGGG